jgi:hypothetical protein
MTAKPNGPLREELEEAIVKIRHQIEIQSMSDHYIGSEKITEDALSELQSELAELEDALDRLK